MVDSLQRRFTTTIYMGPKTYYYRFVTAQNIADASRAATLECAEANPFWRVIRIEEVSLDTDEAPLAINHGGYA